MRSSQRIGKSKVKTELGKEGISNELKNSLWTLFLEVIVKSKKGSDPYSSSYSERTNFFRAIWIHYYKLPIDNLPMYNGQVDEYEAKTTIRKWFYEAEWFYLLDFVEFCLNYDENDYAKIFNNFLQRELSAYRIIDGVMTEVNSKEEIVEIEQALNNSDKFTPVKDHLKRALELYSDLKNPDYRNSVKESISAVESLCKIILKNEKTTLGKALSVIEKNHNLPKSLKSAFSSLYGYTSDEGGIRHSLLENNVKIENEEARFMLITCSAFINYLINKI